MSSIGQSILADDLLEGAEAIAAELGWPRRRVYHVVEIAGGWPIWKENGIIFSARSALRAHIENRARDAMNKTRPVSSEGQINGDHQSSRLETKERQNRTVVPARLRRRRR